MAAIARLLASSTHLRISGVHFDASHVALMRLRPRLLQYPPEKAQRFLNNAMERLETTPEVESASWWVTAAC